VKMPDVSAKGAKDYSPGVERSGTPGSHALSSEPLSRGDGNGGESDATHCEYVDPSRRPFSGARPFLLDKPGVPLRFTPGFSPPHPAGALFDIRHP
jgi:hypothetical protein